jgi:hypothetical protein
MKICDSNFSNLFSQWGGERSSPELSLNNKKTAQINRLGSIKNLRLDFSKTIFAVVGLFDLSFDSYRTGSG